MEISRPSYYLDFTLGDFFYGTNHPMKPVRLNMVHDLIFSYGLNEKMEIKYPIKIPKKVMLIFHSKKYLDFLFEKKEKTKKNFSKNFQEDCPIFSGIFHYCQIYSGGSISGARDLVNGKKNLSLNWPGGLHHAKRGKSSGFCYVNDVVLSILELLKKFEKVLYIDIDIHHGDGVEEAFYLSRRVFCLSFHKYSKNFFPGTGGIENTGIGSGNGLTINVPFKNGIKNKGFGYLFRSIVSRVVQEFNPGAIVVQAGADSLIGDKLGSFGLTIFGHGNCIEFLKNFGIPLLILGGGGYRKTNVARCWTLETSILLDEVISPFLPYNNYWRYFSPSFKLYPSFIPPLGKNTRKNLVFLKNKILNNLKKNF